MGRIVGIIVAALAFMAMLGAASVAAAPTTAATPTLLPLTSYSTFHPMESFPVSWTAAAGAATYVLEASTSSSFPAATKIRFDNITGTTRSLERPPFVRLVNSTRCI